MSQRRIFKWTDIIYYSRLATFLLFLGLWTLMLRTTYVERDSRIPEEAEDPLWNLQGFKVPGPDSLCPEYSKDSGFTERIFFLQMGHDYCLTPRHLCGIESAARANPNLSIYVYFHTGDSSEPPKNYGDSVHGKMRSCEVTELVRRLPNVHFIFEDLVRNYLFNTTFWPLYEKGLFQNSDWTLVHLSDAVRLMMLDRHGGFYLDFDTVTLRPLHCVKNSFSFLEEIPHIENGVMSFDKNHPFMRFIPRYLVQVYDPSSRLILGPPSVAKAFMFYCKQQSLKTGNYSCHSKASVNLLHPDSFYPVRHTGWPKFFSDSFSSEDVKNFTNSFLTHVYMANWGTAVPETSLYANLAKQYCPTVWKGTMENNVLFGF